MFYPLLVPLECGHVLIVPFFLIFPFRAPSSTPLDKARARLLAAQRAFDRERQAQSARDEDLRNRLTKLRAEKTKASSDQRGGNHLPSSYLQKKYIRSFERAQKHREEVAKASQEGKATKLACVGSSSTKPAPPSNLTADFLSDERKVAEVVQREYRRLREENQLLREHIRSRGLDLPQGVRGKSPDFVRLSCPRRYLSPMVQARGQDVVGQVWSPLLWLDHGGTFSAIGKRGHAPP